MEIQALGQDGKPLTAEEQVGRVARRMIEINKHPQRHLIDKEIIEKKLTAKEIVTKWGLAGEWTVQRRRKRLRVLAQRAYERQKKNEKRLTVKKRENRVLDLMRFPLDAAKEGFELAKVEKKLDAGATFLDKYMAAVRIYGEVTGELVPEGQTNVNWQQNTLMHIMSLPRATDTPEQLARAARMGLGGELPASGRVVDTLALPTGDGDDEDGYEDPDDAGDDDDYEKDPEQD